MKQNRLRNQDGAVLIMALFLAVVFAVLAASLVDRYVTITKQNQRYSIKNENLRIANELGKIVASAYEQGVQGGGTCPTGTHMQPVSGVPFCFGYSSASCVVSSFNSSQTICIDFSNVPITERDDQFLHFSAIAVDSSFKSKSPNGFVGLFVPSAFGSMTQSAMPQAPTPISNLAPAAYQCGGGGPALCRKCGPTEANICFELAFCSVDQPSCGSNELKYDMMIEK